MVETIKWYFYLLHHIHIRVSVQSFAQGNNQIYCDLKICSCFFPYFCIRYFYALFFMKKLLLSIFILAIAVSCEPPKENEAAFEMPAVADIAMYQVNPRVFASENSLNAVASRIDSIRECDMGDAHLSHRHRKREELALLHQRLQSHRPGIRHHR